MRLLLTVISLFVGQFLLAQPDGGSIVVHVDSVKLTVMPINVVDGDTLPYHNMAEFTIVEKSAKYRKMEYRVRKVYPYAIIATSLLVQFHLEMDTMQNKREKNRYMKKMKSVLAKEFEDELKNLSVEQGMVLMKLINRESGLTSYSIVQELKGNVSAVMWQTTARLYGSSMKDEYDPEGEDVWIEEMVQSIESGDIKVIERKPKTQEAKDAIRGREKRKATRERRKTNRTMKRLNRRAKKTKDTN
jgi:hypothetical protein